MTKTEIFAKIKEAAENYGLEAAEYSGRMEIRGTWTDIIISEKMDFGSFKRDAKEMTASFTADLFKAADEIRKAATLTEFINGKNYSCIYKMD